MFQIFVYQRPFYIVNIYTMGFLGEGKEGKNLGLNQKIQGYRLIILDKNQSFLVVNKQSLKGAVGKAESCAKGVIQSSPKGSGENYRGIFLGSHMQGQLSICVILFWGELVDFNLLLPSPVPSLGMGAISITN